MGFCYYRYRYIFFLEHSNIVLNLASFFLKSLQLCTTFFGTIRHRGYSISLSRIVDFLELLGGQKIFVEFKLFGIVVMGKRESISCKVTLRRKNLRRLLEYFFLSVVFKLFEKLIWLLKRLLNLQQGLGLYLNEQTLFTGLSKEVLRGVSVSFSFYKSRVYLKRFLSIFGFVV